jgi:hypothetical protein
MLNKSSLRSKRNILIALSASLAISACGGGGSGGGDDTPVIPANAPAAEEDFFAEGIYVGDLTDLTGATTKIGAIVGSDGSFEMTNFQDGDIHYGVLRVTGNLEAEGDVRGLAAPGYYFVQNGESVVDQKVYIKQSEQDMSISGGASFQSVETGRFNLSSSNLKYESPPSSLDVVAGTYSAYINYVDVYLTLNGDGSVDGFDTAGCQYSGSLEQAEAGKNLYNVTYSAQGCSDINGAYVGKAFFSLTPESTALVFITHNNFSGFGGSFTRQID